MASEKIPKSRIIIYAVLSVFLIVFFAQKMGWLNDIKGSFKTSSTNKLPASFAAPSEQPSFGDTNSFFSEEAIQVKVNGDPLSVRPSQQELLPSVSSQILSPEQQASIDAILARMAVKRLTLQEVTLDASIYQKTIEAGLDGSGNTENSAINSDDVPVKNDESVKSKPANTPAKYRPRLNVLMVNPNDVVLEDQRSGDKYSMAVNDKLNGLKLVATKPEIGEAVFSYKGARYAIRTKSYLPRTQIDFSEEEDVSTTTSDSEAMGAENIL